MDFAGLVAAHMMEYRRQETAKEVGAQPVEGHLDAPHQPHSAINRLQQAVGAPLATLFAVFRRRAAQ